MRSDPLAIQARCSSAVFLCPENMSADMLLRRLHAMVYPAEAPHDTVRRGRVAVTGARAMSTGAADGTASCVNSASEESSTRSSSQLGDAARSLRSAADGVHIHIHDNKEDAAQEKIQHGAPARSRGEDAEPAASAAYARNSAHVQATTGVSSCEAHFSDGTEDMNDNVTGLRWMAEDGHPGVSSKSPQEARQREQDRSHAEESYEGTLQDVHLVVKLPAKFMKLNMSKDEWARQAMHNVMDVSSMIHFRPVPSQISITDGFIFLQVTS
jgi:hypothetical protein